MSTVITYSAFPEKERLIRTGHPWVFSGAVKELSSEVSPLDLLPQCGQIWSGKGEFLAWAQVNPASKIRLRLCSSRLDCPPDKKWLRSSLQNALDLRNNLKTASSACRLVFGEADGIPGLVVDRFGDWLVVQLETSGADSWRSSIKEELVPLASACFPGLQGILECSDSDGRRLEGLAEHHETWWGIAPEQAVPITEGSVRLKVRPGSQKTGFYTDQRDNRLLCADYAKGLDVLDVCCYTGGFSAHAKTAGARSLTLVDASAEALELALANLELNTLNGSVKAETRCGDAWETLRILRKEGRQFGMVILDPPKLAPTRQSLEKALRAYKDLNLQGMQLVQPGGYLASFSCSGLVSAEELQTTLAWAAKDAGLRFQIIHRLDQGMDHPVPLHFPDSRYLKGFLLKRMV